MVIAYVIWAFIYFAHPWEAAGGTAGMALFGVQVVCDDGDDVDGCQPIVRTLALPPELPVLGLGFLGILLGDQRRALHDVIAETAVVYLWDARAVAVPVQGVTLGDAPCEARRAGEVRGRGSCSAWRPTGQQSGLSAPL